MRKSSPPAVFAASLLLAVCALQSASAQLPSLEGENWLGYFVGYKSSRYIFGVNSQGEMGFNPDEKQGLVSIKKFSIKPVVQEILPDGRCVDKTMNPESLETTDSATEKFDKVVFRGKVTGDAKFEVTVEQNRGMIFIGGRILEPGNLKNPLRFAVSVKTPIFFKNGENPAKADGEKPKKDPKKGKSPLDKLENDRLTLKWVDGKRVKKTIVEELDLASPEINGPGISEVEIDTQAFKGRKIMFNASPNSAMTLKNANSAPIYNGFSINWVPDAAKDPKGEARLAINAR